MSHLEQQFRQFLSKYPAIKTCYAEKLINRRALARYLIKQNIAKSNQLEAVIAMLRRFDFGKKKENKKNFKEIKISLREGISIIELEKEKEVFKKIQHMINDINYDKGDTFKIVVGSESITLFLDQEKEKVIKQLLGKTKITKKTRDISQISIVFPKTSIDQKGVLATITAELTMHDIIIDELITASAELLLYLKEKDVIQAYRVIKALQQ